MATVAISGLPAATGVAGADVTPIVQSATTKKVTFSAIFAAPPAIGGTTPAAGAFTTVSASSTVSGGQSALGSGATLGGVGGGATQLALRSNQNTSYGLEISTSANVASGVFAAFVNATNAVQGSIQATNSTTTAYVTSSDKRKKRDLGVCTDLSVLENTVIHDFEWIENNAVDRGVFAQDAIVFCPRAVIHDEKGDFWGADYSKYVPDLIVGWQAHKQKIAALESTIAALESRLATLESK